MKGVLLAGGLGTRLAPLTQNDNKHLLPVYKHRMVEYPISSMVDAGVTDLMIVTGGNRPGAFLELIRDGKQYGLESVAYSYQKGNGGVADALKPAWEWCAHDPFLVMLGDNYFEESIILPNIDNSSATAFLQKTDTPWYFGIATLAGGKIVDITEKPKQTKSDLAILGCYKFNFLVWRFLSELTPSARAELEITDLLKQYMINDELDYIMYDGYWSDMGTFESWMSVSQRIASQDLQEK